MAISNYSQLQTALQNYTGRSDTTFTDRVTEFISQAENYINRKIKWLPGVTETTVSTAQSSDTAALPSGFVELVSLRYQGNDYYLKQLSLQKLLGVLDDNEARPEYFAVADTFRFNVPADAVYTLDCDYEKKWDIANDSTNALLTQYEDVYLEACLWRAYKWMKNNEQASQHYAYMNEAIDDVNHTSGRNRGDVHMPVDAGIMARRGKFNIFNGH